jgi:tetratricopeptide (TPR) repeat protein
LADAWHRGGWIKIWLGDPQTALEWFARAMRLSPLDPMIPWMKIGTAHSYFFLARYDEAVSWAALSLQDDPDSQAALRISAASNALAGRPEEAHKAAARLHQLYPTLRVSNLKEVLGPYRDADLSLYENGMRQAGLPD